MAQVARLVRQAAFVIALVCLAPVAGWTQGPSEYQVKAAYLYGFGRFTEWPISAPANASPSFVLCVIGTDPFSHWLDDVVTNATMKNRPVRIQHITEPTEAAGCHTLFISASEDVRLAKILDAIGEAPVLTVSDAPRFAQRGGVVGFFDEGHRVRFTVNLAVAQKTGLTLNAELLRVSASVIKGGKP